ncbi:uncharacterized protein N7482_004205 [Penicillium canariense]|uniref:Uncharacterized protein n=1 Tax=Penicillium canariense TaxID=189055 RepID=A0A9W9LPW1_9EURO|nr:uncharacterized protein N7482_004205 [Penicillium canariense]KAJ5168611.1 hypothetical protein N7482_004205 [Penicillium canariense]
MRENLIRWETLFDLTEFAHDLVGNEADPGPFSQPPYSPPAKPVKDNDLISGEENDVEVTANRKDTILSGETYDVNSWEMTPGFLRKLAWAMERCGELMSQVTAGEGSEEKEPLHILVFPESPN